MPPDDPAAEAVLAFWFGPEPFSARPEWWRQDAAFDAEIRGRFAPLVAAAAIGTLDGWAATPRGAVALVILLDQFSRNLHREDGRAWASDARALSVARAALAAGLDLGLPPLLRQFLYMPFMHSEDVADHDRSVALFRLLGGVLPDRASFRSALRHREIVARFGRFPHRNARLGRATTPEEAAFLAEPDSSF